MRRHNHQRSDQTARQTARRPLDEQCGDQPQQRPHSQLSLYPARASSESSVSAPRPATGIFNPHLFVFQLEATQESRRQLKLASTLQVASRWREAILSHSNGLSEAAGRLLSGHGDDGGPADTAHLAFLPFALIGREHADGHLLGMGLALPANLSCDERHEALRAVIAVQELKLGPLGLWRAAPVTVPQPSRTLQPATWTAYPAGATQWSTVTPFAFDRHPKAKDKARYQQQATTSIAEACTRIGLPRPREVIVTQASVHLGVPPAFAFPRLRRKDGSERRHGHAILVFDEPVCGPLLIGAGRFRGYGACRPIDGDLERS